MSEPITSQSPFDLQPPAPKVPVGNWWSTWEDCLDIFYSPTAVFTRRRDGRYGFTLLVLCLATMASYFLAIQMMEAIGEVEMHRVFASRGLSATEIAAAQAGAAKVTALTAYLLPGFMAIGMWAAGLGILVLGKLMGAKLDYGQSTTIAVLGAFPGLLNKILVGTQGLVIDTSTVAHRYSYSFNASRFLPADADNWLLKLGSVADPFIIWGAVLVGIGTFVIGQMEKEKAAVLSIVYLAIVTAVFG